MNFQESHHRLKKGKRRVIYTRLMLGQDQQHIWVLIPRSPSERPGKPHLQLVALRNLELMKA